MGFWFYTFLINGLVFLFFSNYSVSAKSRDVTELQIGVKVNCSVYIYRILSLCKCEDIGGGFDFWELAKWEYVCCVMLLQVDLGLYASVKILLGQWIVSGGYYFNGFNFVLKNGNWGDNKEACSGYSVKQCIFYGVSVCALL